MTVYVVLQNAEKTHTTLVAFDDVELNDYVAFDGSPRRVVATFEARSLEQADLQFEMWQERHRYVN